MSRGSDRPQVRTRYYQLSATQLILLVNPDGRLLAPSDAFHLASLDSIAAHLKEFVKISKNLYDHRSTQVAENVLQIVHDPRGFVVGVDVFLKLIDKHCRRDTIVGSTGPAIYMISQPLGDAEFRLIRMLAIRFKTMSTESKAKGNEYHAALLLQESLDMQNITTRFPGRFSHLERLKGYFRVRRHYWWLVCKITDGYHVELPTELLAKIQDNLYDDAKIQALLKRMYDDTDAGTYGSHLGGDGLDEIFSELRL